MKVSFAGKLEDIADLENLLEAWREFSRGKKNKTDVQEFSLCLMDNLLSLCDDLINHHSTLLGASHEYFSSESTFWHTQLPYLAVSPSNRTYRHGGYQAFRISDPKPRDIHKATVRDRVLHHAIYRILYPFFDKTFIADSFSCRINKGTHRAIRRFASFGKKASWNNMRTCWVLKCDIRKFFASIDQKILMDILKQYIPDKGLLQLLEEVVGSFSSTGPGKGLPLGNLTSQLLVNVYMNEFDRFVKHKLKVKYYIRYADDFVIFSPKKEELEYILARMDEFLRRELKLALHPDKVLIKTLASGVDFLGWVHFSNHRVLRTATRRRMMKRIIEHPTLETVSSYLGLLCHGNTRKLQEKIYKRAS